MKQSMLNTFLQGTVIFVLMFSLAAITEADELSQKLASHFDASDDFKYIDYESIDQVHADEFGNMRYLVMDFDLALASVGHQNNDLQHSIHSICSKVLKDHSLLLQLSDAGFDMVSVSFDKQSQYDCL